MSLTSWRSSLLPSFARSGRREMTSLQREMDELMDSFFEKKGLAVPHLYDFNLYPAIDVKEEEGKYVCEAELPGLTEGDISLDLHNNILTIKGEKKSEMQKKESDYTCTERYFGSFRRDIPFGDEVNPEEVKAQLKNGVLKIELEKKEKSKVSHKKIAIAH